MVPRAAQSVLCVNPSHQFQCLPDRRPVVLIADNKRTIHWKSCKPGTMVAAGSSGDQGTDCLYICPRGAYITKFHVLSSPRIMDCILSKYSQSLDVGK